MGFPAEGTRGTLMMWVRWRVGTSTSGG